jgi:hypothetical protein
MKPHKKLADNLERFYIIDGEECDTYRVLYWQDSPYNIRFEVRHAQEYDGVSVFDEAYHQVGPGLSCMERMPVFLRGRVSCDGCSDFSFHTKELHHCDRKGMVAIGTLLGRIFDQCAAIIKEAGILVFDIGQLPVIEDKLPWVSFEPEKTEVPEQVESAPKPLVDPSRVRFGDFGDAQ